MDPKLQTRLEKLLMVSTTERYALMFELGLPEIQVSMLNMEGSPWVVASNVVRKVEQVLDAAGQAKFAQLVSALPLPAGIPE